MVDLFTLGSTIAEHRKSLKLTQTELARKAGISRATLDAIENGRARELGFSKVARLLAAAGLELTLQTARAQRPTLEDLLEENRKADSLVRRN